MSWWVELGYPPFDEGKGGFPKTGQVVKYYRERKKDDKGKPYTQKAFAKVLGISDIAVREIENRDVGMDFERRQFLSKLFNIPPILLGVVTLEQINKILEEKGITLSALLTPVKPSQRTVMVSTPVSTVPKLVVDVNEYRQQLVSCWNTHYSHDAYGGLADTLWRTSMLYQELPHVSPKERRQLHELLCSYHQLAANLSRDRQLYDDAVIHLNKAFQMAKLLRNDELKALVLFSRGWIFWSAHRVDHAVIDFQKARMYERNLPCYLNSPILLLSGQAKAVTAESKREKEDAIALIDRGGNIVRKSQNRDNPHFIDFSLSRYHLVRTSALLAVGRNKDALDELKLVNLNDHTNVRRQVYNDILEAQAYTNLGDYSRATSFAETALLAAQELQSTIYIARVAKIYQQLEQSPYKNNPDVARLEYLLYYKPGTL
jgi:tetratricopeptide (TPR) repeat protein